MPTNVTDSGPTLVELAVGFRLAMVAASTSLERSNRPAWLGPSVIASGATEVTLACPVSVDGSVRLSCFGPRSLLFVGGVQGTVLGVSLGEDAALVRLPSSQAVCGSSSTAGGDGGGEAVNASGSAPSIGSCGVQAVLIANPPVDQTDDQSTTLRWPPDISDILLKTQPVPSRRTHTSSSRQLQSTAGLQPPPLVLAIDDATARLLGRLCPKDAFDLAWRLAPIDSTIGSEASIFSACVVLAPVASLSSLEADTDNTPSMQIAAAATGSAVLASDGGLSSLLLQGAVEYVEQCVGYPEPGALCADRDAVRAGLVCAFGAGEQCRPCPAGAACPGGFKAHPLPGYWTESPESGVVIRCEPPAEERCLGWDAGVADAVCGVGYRQGSAGCSRCEEGRYPESDGSCRVCPSAPSAWLLL